MNLKKILASVAAAAVTVSAMSVVASANTVFNGDFGLDIVVIADEGLTWKLDLAAKGVLDENVKVGDVYGATITFTQASHDAYVSGAAGMGGAFVFSGSGSAKNWNAIEWGNDAASKPIVYDDNTRTITRLDSAPYFDETDISGADDTKAYICLQGYWGPDTLEVESIALLGKDGSVLKTFPNDYVASGDEPTSEPEPQPEPPAPEPQPEPPTSEPESAPAPDPAPYPDPAPNPEPEANGGTNGAGAEEPKDNPGTGVVLFAAPAIAAAAGVVVFKKRK